MNKYLWLFLCLTVPGLVYAQTPVFQWATNIADTNDARGTQVAVDQSGNVVSAGEFMGIGDFDPGPGVLNLNARGGYCAYVQKLDAQKNLIWTKQIGDSIGDFVFVNAMTTDFSGNILIAGYFQGNVDFDPGPGTFTFTSTSIFFPMVQGIYVLKLDANGNFVWARWIETWDDYLSSITCDSFGNVCATGSFDAKTDFDPGPGIYNLIPTGTLGYVDIFILKLNASGNFIWAGKMGGTSYDAAYAVRSDPAGNFYLTGLFNGIADFDPGIGVNTLTASVESGFVAKVNSSGNLVWVKQIGGINDRVNGNSLALDLSGNICVIGTFSLTADFDPGPNLFYLISQGTSMFTLKLDSGGNFVWAKGTDGAPIPARWQDIGTDGSGNMYSMGNFTAAIDFDPGPGSFVLTPFGSGPDIFISKLDAWGNFLWAGQVGGISYDEGHCIAVNPNGDLYTTGSFSLTADFDPGAGQSNITCTGYKNPYLFKLSNAQSVGVDEFYDQNIIFVYPNPTENLVRIDISKPGNDRCIKLYSATGALIYSCHLSGLNKEIDLTNQPNGIFLINVIEENKIIISKKIVKQ